MRIVITGTAGIGKTTLANHLANQLNYPLIEENLAPLVIALSQLQNAQKNHEDQKPYLNAYISTGLDWLAERKRLQTTYPEFVADRFAFDLLARWILQGIGNDNDRWLSQVILECQQQAQQIDLIVIPPVTELSQQKANAQGLQRHNGLGRKILSQSLTIGLTHQLSNKPRLHLPVHAVTTEQRAALVLDAISQLKT